MFFFRADANAVAGAGHLTRCLTIAEALAELRGKEEICFICAEASSAELAAEQGFSAFALHTDYREMESELPQWETLFSEYRKKGSGERHVVVVDSYWATERYLTALCRESYVALMDDFGTKAYPADCIVNYNAPARLEEYRRLYGNREVKLLVGSSYTPVRRQFCDKTYSVRSRACCVLLTTGGGDKDNIAGKILERIYDEHLDFYVAAGRFHPNVEKLRAIKAPKANVHICRDVKDMAALMKKCDVAVTAGGTTIYELAALGIPFVCFSYAKNQDSLTEYIGREGLAKEAGAWHKDPEKTLERLAEALEYLIKNREARSVMSHRLKRMIDGRGAGRLAEELSKWVSPC